MKSTTTFLSFALLVGCMELVHAQTMAPQLEITPPKTPRRVIPPDPFAGLATLDGDTAQILISTTKTQFTGNESIVLDISLKNTGTKLIKSLTGNDEPDYFFDIQVTDLSGAKLPFFQETRERRKLGLGTSAWTVGPERPMKARVWLNMAYHFKYCGKYQVVVSKKFRRDNAVVTVSSQPLTFEITSISPVAQWE